MDVEEMLHFSVSRNFKSIWSKIILEVSSNYICGFMEISGCNVIIHKGKQWNVIRESTSL
jgi:hypothetical protein